MSWFTVKTRSFTGGWSRHHKIKLPDHARVYISGAGRTWRRHYKLYNFIVAERGKARKCPALLVNISRPLLFSSFGIAMRRDATRWAGRPRAFYFAYARLPGLSSMRRTRDKFRATRASSIEIFVPKTSKFSKRPGQLRVALHLRVCQYCFRSSTDLENEKH